MNIVFLRPRAQTLGFLSVSRDCPAPANEQMQELPCSVETEDQNVSLSPTDGPECFGPASAELPAAEPAFNRLPYEVPAERIIPFPRFEVPNIADPESVRKFPPIAFLPSLNMSR